MSKIIFRLLSVIIVSIGIVYFAHEDISRVLANASLPFNGAIKLPPGNNAVIQPAESMGNIPGNPDIHSVSESSSVCGQTIKVLDYKIYRNSSDLKVIDPGTGKIKSTTKIVKKGFFITDDPQGYTLLPSSDLIVVNLQNLTGAINQSFEYFLFYHQSVDFPSFNVIANDQKTTIYFYVPVQNKENKEYFLYLRCIDSNAFDLKLGKYKYAYSTWSIPIENIASY